MKTVGDLFKAHRDHSEQVTAANDGFHPLPLLQFVVEVLIPRERESAHREGHESGKQ